MEVLKKNHLNHNKSAALVLENGEILWGYGLGVQKAVVGELCFNTSHILGLLELIPKIKSQTKFMQMDV